MFLVLKLIYNSWKEFDAAYMDRRIENYPIVSNPMNIIILPLLYYVVVKHLGPQLMENRKAFELKNTILLYNLVQVICNIYISMRAIYVIYWQYRDSPTACHLPLKDNSPKSVIELHLSYCYFLLKFFDYMDTIFMVLRKRYRQVSFLHVYHHIMISVGCFGGMRYLPGGHASLFGILNSLVHTIMYTYYFLSALRPELKNSIWWKKHITQAQMLQFFILLIHFSRPLWQESCKYPKAIAMIGVTQALVMMLLFGDFYRRAYLKKKTTKID